MSKISLTNITNLQNESTAVAAMNVNSSVIQTAMENTLSRDGTTPNTMASSLDMNSNTIINLPAPATSTEPVRLADLTDYAPTIIFQASQPATSYFAGSMWIDSDSTDEDVYQLVSDVWTDTGVNMKGATGATGAAGSMTGPVSSVDSEIVVFNGITGTLVKRATNTGILKAASGVIATATSGTDYAPATSGSSVLSGNGSGGFTNLTAGVGYVSPSTNYNNYYFYL